jgi:hypothetical protein
MIGIVIEKHDLPAEFPLQSPRGRHLSKQKPLRKKSAGLLAEADDRGASH